MRENRVQTGLLMLILLVLWGSFAAVGKLTLQTLDSMQSLFFMFLSAALLMTFQYAFSGRLGALRRLSLREWAMLAVLSVPSFLYYFFYYMALKRIPAVEASLLNYLFPVFILLLSIPVNHEPFGWCKLGSVVFGFAGILVVITRGNLHSIRLSNLAGDLLAIGAAISWATFSVFGKQSKVDIYLGRYVYTIIGLVLSAPCLLIFSRPVVPGLPALAGSVWIGLSSIVLGYYLWFRILKTTSSAMAASMSFITPFVTFLFIALFLHEKITTTHMAGLVLVIGGIVFQQLPTLLRSREF